MSIGLIKHNKYYYLIVGRILRVLDRVFHFVFYKCGAHKLIKLVTGHWIFRPGLTWNGARDYEYLMTYKMLKDRCGPAIPFPILKERPNSVTGIVATSKRLIDNARLS